MCAKIFGRSHAGIVCAKDLFIAAKEETPAARGYVLAGVRSLCLVEASHIVGRSDQVVALIAA
jgi:hypothetical protein